LLHTDLAEVAAEPETWALRAAESLGVTVLLKGHKTHIAGPGGSFTVEAPTTWLATAGTGDALGGILGALVTTHAREIASDDGMLTRLAATASVIHGLSAEYAGGGGPFTVLELCAAIPAVVADLLRRKVG
jgi:NAD(P)H-hydrate repair Nnr-like enzyme with NAD(P)H-hydrate dehydratase domain